MWIELALYMDAKIVSNHGYLNIQVHECAATNYISNLGANLWRDMQFGVECIYKYSLF